MSTDIDFEIAEEELEIEVSEPTTQTAEEAFSKSIFRVVYQTSNYFLPQIKDLLDTGKVINTRPEYQRRLRWTNQQKSKLIESLLLNIPVPPVFLYENDAARYEVMDGQQRLNAVKSFLRDEFTLSSLQVLRPLNRLKYSQCPLRVQRSLDRSSISAIVLLLESEIENSSTRITLKDIRRFIFDRLNTGGTKLNPQEIRNALNPGQFNKMLLNVTRLPIFTKIFGIPAYSEEELRGGQENPDRHENGLYSSMGDCELALRYFALKDRGNIRGSMRAILDRTMEQEITEATADQLTKEFADRLDFLYRLFDEQPFLLSPDRNGHRRLSAAIYDASMVAIHELWASREAIQANAEAVKRNLSMHLDGQDGLYILTGKGNTANLVLSRIDMMRSILMSVNS